MKIEITNKWMQSALVMFLSLGALAHGVVVLSYALWFMGLWPEKV